jgi:hypothetical protein
MTLEKLGAGIDFVSDTTPAASDAVDGDLFLDTSLSPPEVKVFDSSVSGFIRPQTAQNLDRRLSEAAVDWSSKTPVTEIGAASTPNEDVIIVSGSGYMTQIKANNDAPDFSIRLEIDGVKQFDDRLVDLGGQDVGSSADGDRQFSIAPTFRFESGFVLGTGSSLNGVARMAVFFVLD